MAYDPATGSISGTYWRQLTSSHGLTSAIRGCVAARTTVLWFCIAAAYTANVGAGVLKVAVNDPQGLPVANAVVTAELIQSTDPTPLAMPAGESQTVTISQKNEQFEPIVSVVRKGTVVSFPNQDDILHNVYSFSNAKKFQLPLYRDKAPTPVTFDKPGTVILGCNIHDWMVAYVYVVDTPYFRKTSDDGFVELNNLPAGSYRVRVDHPRKRKRGSTAPQTLSIGPQDTLNTEFVIALKPEWRPRKHTTQPTRGD
ncbi:MAG: methylamine utilization protein [Gammaproteobacteria bacterium]|nr:methylamine utilization protein [Gammaproteobacteria bacterium]